MLTKKIIGAALACGLALGAFSGMALATPVTVDGITWDPAAGNDLTVGAASFRESSAGGSGDVLTGYGSISNINGVDFCGAGNLNCDLTFTFSYTVKSVTPHGDGTTSVVFNDGSINLYVQGNGTYNVGDPTSIDTSNLWLSLTGHSLTYPGYSDEGQLFATVYGDPASPEAQSSGFGFLDVVEGAGAGAANNHFNTDTQRDGSDLKLNSSFSTKIWSTCTAPSSNPANICHYPISGSGNIFGKSALFVPEPGEIGLLGLGLAALGLLMRKRRKEAEDRQ